MENVMPKVPELELNKKYDIVYVTTYDVNYLDRATVAKITKKMYYLDFDDGSSFKIRIDSVIEAKEIK